MFLRENNKSNSWKIMKEVLVGDIWTIKAVWICVPCSKVSTKNTQYDNRDDFMDHLKRHCHICYQAFTR